MHVLRETEAEKNRRVAAAKHQKLLTKNDHKALWLVGLR